MAPRVYAPRLTAWLASLLLIVAGTAAGIAPLRPLSAAGSAAGQMHGVVVAVDNDGRFAMRVPGRGDRLWLRPASGAHLSLAHLRRHMHERASTDVRYEVGAGNELLAEDAD